MKTRNGFVSNSSSSSFIVGFPKGMSLTKESIREYLFKPEQKFIDCYDDEPSSVSVETAAEIIARDMVPCPLEKLHEELGGWTYESDEPKYDNFRIPVEGKREWDWKCDEKAYDLAVEKFEKAYSERIIKKLDAEHNDLYVLNFSDNDGSTYAILEHGNTFNNIPSIVINHH